MIKKINLWKMIGLYVVTLGIYGFFWIARRRSEIIKSYKLPVPHWLWLLVPSLAGIVLLIPLIILAYGATSNTESLIYVATGLMLIAGLVAFGISIWWMCRYGTAVEKITSGRVTLGWNIVYWIFLGPVTFFMNQYYFNRLPKTIPKKYEAKYKPTKKFIFASIAIIVLSLTMSALSYVVWPVDDAEWTTFQQEAREIDHKLDEANRLSVKYDECIDRLDQKFPGELMAEDEQAYNTGYSVCEKIRLEQNKAADEYDAAMRSW